MDKSWRVILAFVGIFVAGTVTGGLITLRVVQTVGKPREARSANLPNQGPQSFNPQLMRRIAEQLDLTREQREKMKPIEAHTAEDLRRLRRENLHSTELIIERMQDEIAAILTPEQHVKFEELIMQTRERIRKYILEQDRAKRREGVPVPDRARELPPRK